MRVDIAPAHTLASERGIGRAQDGQGGCSGSGMLGARDARPVGDGADAGDGRVHGVLPEVAGFELKIVATPSRVWKNFNHGDGSEIEVTEFLVHDVDPLVILRQMTHMFELKMLTEGSAVTRCEPGPLSDLPNELIVDEISGPQEDQQGVPVAAA